MPLAGMYRPDRARQLKIDDATYTAFRDLRFFLLHQAARRWRRKIQRGAMLDALNRIHPPATPPALHGIRMHLQPRLGIMPVVQ